MKIRDGKFLLKIAETPAEKKQIYALRYSVYCQELNYAGNTGQHDNDNIRESDYFDELCDHLIIRDEEHNRCVGTFRFLSGSRLPQDGGFYSEQWFNIGKLSEKRSQILELGRACIDAQYRNTSVFKLLFAGVGAYLKLYPHDYLIGLTTLPANAKDDIDIIRKYLIGNNAVNVDFEVQPIKRLAINPADQGELALAEMNHRSIIKKMSTLMFAYYKYGAEFISEPSMDINFNPPVFDFFTIFDAHKFPAWVTEGLAG